MFRLDRFLTLYFFYPLLKRRRLVEDLRIPILMYHSVSNNAEDSVHPYYRLNTSPTRFTQQMKFLHDNNYRVISLTEAADLLNQPLNRSISQRINNSTNQPLNYVVLTFDDGYHDFLTHAWPVLKDFEYTATVFLPTAFIDEKHKKFKGKQCLAWDEIRKLNTVGIEFGSHTISHAPLYELPWNKIEKELLNSKMRLENELQTTVYCFSYPFAFPQEDRHFVSRFKKELSDQGYRAAVTTAIGRARKDSDPLCFERQPINEGDDQKLFEAKLVGAYDWMASAQAFVRRIKFSAHNNRYSAGKV